MKKSLIILSILIAGCIKPNEKVSVSKQANKISTVSTVVSCNTNLIIMTGESNSNGAAQNKFAFASELGVRSGIRILNNSTYKFDTLRIGINNVSQSTATLHGWELGLANSVDSGTLPKPVYTVKTGIGGTKAADWDTSGTRFKRSIRLIDSAVSKLNALEKPFTIAIWYTQGINDAQATPPTTGSTWISQTKIILNAYKAHCPNSQIYMTHIQPVFTDFNNYITTVCNEVSDCHGIVISDISGSGTLVHWPYATMKAMAARIVWTMKAYGYY